MIFFFNDTATTEIYTLSLHDALPIYSASSLRRVVGDAAWTSVSVASRACTSIPRRRRWRHIARPTSSTQCASRSEEHTSELQSRQYLVCRLLLEKKNKKSIDISRSSQ